MAKLIPESKSSIGKAGCPLEVLHNGVVMSMLVLSKFLLQDSDLLRNIDYM